MGHDPLPPSKGRKSSARSALALPFPLQRHRGAARCHPAWQGPVSCTHVRNHVSRWKRSRYSRGTFFWGKHRTCPSSHRASSRTAPAPNSSYCSDRKGPALWAESRSASLARRQWCARAPSATFSRWRDRRCKSRAPWTSQSPNDPSIRAGRRHTNPMAGQPPLDRRIHRRSRSLDPLWCIDTRHWARPSGWKAPVRIDNRSSHSTRRREWPATESRSRPLRNGSEWSLFCRLAWRISLVGTALTITGRRDCVLSLLRSRASTTLWVRSCRSPSPAAKRKNDEPGYRLIMGASTARIQSGRLR